MDLTGLPFVIAPMRKSDISTVARIEREVFALPWSSMAFRYELEQNASSHYVVVRYKTDDSTPEEASLVGSMRQALGLATGDASQLGYAGCWLTLDEAHISTLAVRLDWRRMGLGELLLATMVETARERDARVVTLEVRVSNCAAIRLYEKYGFRRVGRRKAYYSDNREDAHIMTTDPIATQQYGRRLATLQESLRQRLAHAAATTRVHAGDPPRE